MSKTIENLAKSFIGESQARNRYSYFASVAKGEGLEQIAGIFQETSDNEREHAKLFFRLLGKQKFEVPAMAVTGQGDTSFNLDMAAQGEHYEWETMYPEFEKVAREEGEMEAAELFHQIAQVEAQHEKRYLKLLDNVKNEAVFKKDQPVKWHCRNCGYVHEGAEAPGICPTCGHPRAFYEIFAENY